MGDHRRVTVADKPKTKTGFYENIQRMADSFPLKKLRFETPIDSLLAATNIFEEIMDELETRIPLSFQRHYQVVKLQDEFCDVCKSSKSLSLELQRQNVARYAIETNLSKHQEDLVDECEKELTEVKKPKPKMM